MLNKIMVHGRGNPYSMNRKRKNIVGCNGYYLSFQAKNKCDILDDKKTCFDI